MASNLGGADGPPILWIHDFFILKKVFSNESPVSQFNLLKPFLLSNGNALGSSLPRMEIQTLLVGVSPSAMTQCVPREGPLSPDFGRIASFSNRRFSSQ